MNSHTTITTEIDEGETAELTANQSAFLTAFATCGIIRNASEASGVHRSNHSRWLQESEDYTRAFEAARQDACDTLEIEARRRAVDGLRSYKFHHGVPIQNPLWQEGDPPEERWYYETTFSDRLLELLLRAARPEVFRDHQTVELAGTVEFDQQIRRQIIENPEASELLCQALEKLTANNPMPDALPEHMPSLDPANETG